ncbi:hypothetical protein DVH05_009228 [Phytophthora capsici]|nr:hypothetical protein DVH05_009228 [Phytophthora capsici]
MFRVAVVRTGRLDDDGGPTWTIEVTKEERCHNHVTNKTIYTALKPYKDLVSESVLSMLDAFGQTNTETKQIASYIADSVCLPVSTQQVRNLLNARLGHSSAEDRLKYVLSEFAADENNECAVLQGEWAQTIGIVL